jgi:MYXO-CTERM domain-containing protein
VRRHIEEPDYSRAEIAVRAEVLQRAMPSLAASTDAGCAVSSRGANAAAAAWLLLAVEFMRRRRRRMRGSRALGLQKSPAPGPI